VSKGETTLVSYEYDALGRRVKSTGLPSAGVVRYYLSSGQNEVAEYDGLGQRLRYYVHGPTYIDERVVMHNDPLAGGAATTGSDYVYLLKDLYTVAGMADERGWPVERYDYDAYGKVYMERVRVLPWAADFDGDGDVDADDLAVLHAAYKGSGQEPNGVRGWRADLDGDGDVDGSDYAVFADAYRGSGVAPGGGLSLRSASMVVSRIGNPYFFTGRRLDVIDIQNAGTPHHFTDDYAGLQIYDYRARTYDPVVGRFDQRDPQGLKGAASRGSAVGDRFVERDPTRQYRDGMDLYEYTRSTPTKFQDPSGLGATEVANNVARCRADWIECTANARLDPVGVAKCAAQWAICAQDVIPPFNSLPDSSPECDKYGCKDEYQGANARCFCKCAGNSPWSQYVRGCLRQLYDQGVDPDLAHWTCYNMAHHLSGGDTPTSTLAYCYAKCWIVQRMQ